MTRELFLRLVLPLSIVFTLSVVLASTTSGGFDAGSFFTNVATDILAIILMVFYVNWVLETHRKRDWAAVTVAVEERLRDFTSRTTIVLNRHLGYLDIDMETLFSLRYSDIPAYTVRRLQHVIASMDLKACVRSVHGKEWSAFVDTLQSTQSEVTSLVGNLGPYLRPEVLSALLRLQGSISAVIHVYSVSRISLHDGAPDSPMREQACKSIAHALSSGFLAILDINHYVPVDESSLAQVNESGT